MPEELRMEVHDIVQEAVIKTIPKKKKCKKGKEEAREFQRIARRDKKACLCEQCKEIEEKDRMGKIRDSRQENSKRTFHAKRGTIKDRNGMNITDAEEL